MLIGGLLYGVEVINESRTAPMATYPLQRKDKKIISF